MNKFNPQSDEARHQEGELNKQRFEEKHREQAEGDSAPQQRDGGYRSPEQQRSEAPKDRRQGGWNPDEDKSGRKPAEDRDRDYDPDGDRVSSDR